MLVFEDKANCEDLINVSGLIGLGGLSSHWRTPLDGWSPYIGIEL